MVTKSKQISEKEKEGKVKVRRLKLNKETVKDLTGSEQKQIKGGRYRAGPLAPSVDCFTGFCGSGSCGLPTDDGRE